MWKESHHETPEEQHQSLAPKNLRKRPVQADVENQATTYGSKSSCSQSKTRKPRQNVEKLCNYNRTSAVGCGAAPRDPSAAASAGPQPARLGRNGNRAFTRRADNIKYWA